MQVKFSTAAEFELDDASLYYDASVPGLGAQFRGEVERSAFSVAVGPYADALA